MNIQYQYLAAEHISARRQEAQRLRRGEQVARTLRLSRRAERLGDRARLAEHRVP